MTSLQPMTHGISQWQLSPKRQISAYSSQPPCVAYATFNSVKRTTPSPNADNDIKTAPLSQEINFRNKFQISPRHRFRPAYCIGNLIVSAAVASAEDHKHAPLAPWNLMIVFRHPIPYRCISVVLRTSANGDMGHILSAQNTTKQKNHPNNQCQLSNHFVVYST